jgi:hypothetical protein
MDAILSMPLPMSTALMVLMVIAAFFFIKVMALIVTPSYNRRYVRVVPQQASRHERRSREPAGRRVSDHRRPDGRVVTG